MEGKGAVSRKEKKAKSKKSGAPKPKPLVPPPEDEPKNNQTQDKPLRSKKSKGVAPSPAAPLAPAPAPSKPKTPVKDSNTSMLSETGDDYDDDDFDDYDDDDFDDFEDESPKKPTPKKPEAKKSAPKAAPPAKAPAPAPGKFTKRTSKYGGSSKVQLSSKYSKSTPLNSFNPNAKRVQNIKSQTRMSSQSFVALDEVPATKYQVYAAKLKSTTTESTSGVREWAIQFNSESRPAECQTEEVTCEDKEVLARNGEDDTVFENMLACCQKGDLTGLRKLLPTKKVGEDEVGEDDDLNGFLERASKVVEGLCEENLMRFGRKGGKGGGRRDGLWEGGGLTVKFAGDKQQKINQILLGRSTAAVLSPTYTTSHLTFGSGAHSSKVVSVCVGGGGINSIDDRGMMTTWFISEVKRGQEEVGEVDLGLGVSGGLKLTQSRTAWVTENGIKQADANYLSEGGGETSGWGSSFGPEVTGMYTFNEGSRNNFFLVARPGGKVLLCDKFSGVVKPYASGGFGNVGGVSFNKFVEGAFLVARADGSIELYRGEDFGVVMRWGAECWGGADEGEGFSVEWSPHRPALFYVYAAGRVFYVDLMEDDCGVGIEGGQNLEEGVGMMGITKGSKNVGKVAMVGGGDGGVLAMRYVCEEMVTEVERLSEESELDWMKEWVDGVTY
ncbi:hypothetical protein TrRE_jg11024 [Triparma retinervis]|uniref:Uncharacterized protein n=1 Tax=Triparma retinervis TaxID=2557542 RepID=A0A9W7CCJ4_9STRA|nr:hypothetical protein TrRE_jg11024 [Triparma retinervis]